MPFNFAYTYDSGNLMEPLLPSQITSLTFYASGHTYRASVAQIELLGEQWGHKLSAESQPPFSQADEALLANDQMI